MTKTDYKVTKTFTKTQMKRKLISGDRRVTLFFLSFLFVLCTWMILPIILQLTGGIITFKNQLFTPGGW